MSRTFAAYWAALLTLLILSGCNALQFTLGAPQAGGTAEQQLLIAVADSNLEEVAALLNPALTQPVADVNTKNAVGSTPLMLAVATGNMKVFEVLLRREANVHTQNFDGFSALHFAAQEGLAAFAERLLQNGADIEIQTVGGATPLYVAAQHGHLDVAKVLLSWEAETDAEFETGATPLLAAAQYGSKEVVELLVESGADMMHVNNNKVSAMHFAAFHQDGSGVIDFLYQMSMPVDILDKWNDTPLDYAAYFGNVKVVRTLLDLNANPEAVDTRGTFPSDSICLCQNVGDSPGRIACPQGNCDEDSRDKLAKLLMAPNMAEDPATLDSHDFDAEYSQESNTAQSSEVSTSQQEDSLVSACDEKCAALLDKNLVFQICMIQSQSGPTGACMKSLRDECLVRDPTSLALEATCIDRDCVDRLIQLPECASSIDSCWRSVMVALVVDGWSQCN